MAGAQAPKPAGSEANEDLTLLRRLLGVEPESQRLSAARFAHYTTVQFVNKRKMHFQAINLLPSAVTYLEYCIDIDTVFSDFHCTKWRAMTFFTCRGPP